MLARYHASHRLLYKYSLHIDLKTKHYSIERPIEAAITAIKTSNGLFAAYNTLKATNTEMKRTYPKTSIIIRVYTFFDIAYIRFLTVCVRFRFSQW